MIRIALHFFADLKNSHVDWQIATGQGLAAYQSSIRFHIVGEKIKHSRAIGADCAREAR